MPHLSIKKLVAYGLGREKIEVGHPGGERILGGKMVEGGERYHGLGVKEAWP